MDEIPNLNSTQPATEDGWLDTLLRQASLNAADKTLPELDAEFTARVISALPARTTARSYWRLLPLAAVLGSVSAALWRLTQGQSTLALDRPATLWLQLMPLAVLYWVAWETCFAEPRSPL